MRIVITNEDQPISRQAECVHVHLKDKSSIKAGSSMNGVNNKPLDRLGVDQRR